MGVEYGMKISEQFVQSPHKMTLPHSPLNRKMSARLLINLTKPTMYTIPTIFIY